MIGLVTDSILANIPLMKIKRYYSTSDCDWYIPLLRLSYEKIYYSKIFTSTKYIPYEEEFISGGTGTGDISLRLPEEIESMQLDYSIYSDCDYSIQYFSRGCIRKCAFCDVPKKEGIIKSVSPMNLNPRGKYIRVFDNNFFANPEWKDAIEALIEYDQPVVFDSGIDLRIFNEEQGCALNRIKIKKRIHTAWDSGKENLAYKIKLLSQYIKPYKITIYVLIGYDSTREEDYFRVMRIRELGCDPFVMAYDKNNYYQKHFSRWVNRKEVFKSIPWDEYSRYNRNKDDQI